MSHWNLANSVLGDSASTRSRSVRVGFCARLVAVLEDVGHRQGKLSPGCHGPADAATVYGPCSEPDVQGEIGDFRVQSQRLPRPGLHCAKYDLPTKEGGADMRRIKKVVARHPKLTAAGAAVTAAAGTTIGLAMQSGAAYACCYWRR